MSPWLKVSALLAIESGILFAWADAESQATDCPWIGPRTTRTTMPVVPGAASDLVLTSIFSEQLGRKGLEKLLPGKKRELHWGRYEGVLNGKILKDQGGRNEIA